MKGKMIPLALVLTVALCGQGFAAGLLGNACQPACEQATCDSCAAPGCDLFAGLRSLLACKRCGQACEQPACCEKPAVCAPEPSCPAPCATPLLDRVRCRVAAMKACCPAEPCEPACPEPRCKPKLCRPTLLDAVNGLLGCRKSCCDPCGQGEVISTEAPGAEPAPLPAPPQA